MATNEHVASARDERRLKRLNAKLAASFSNLQSIFDKIRKASESDINRRSFLSGACTAERIRSEFIAILDEKVDCELELNPQAAVEYTQLNAFEELFGIIKYTEANMLAHSTEKPRRQIKLPPLEIACFDGKLESWPLFYETFTSVIHLNDSLNNTEKMQYLLSKLTGKALNICTTITPTGTNYQVIWDTLCNKYQDQRVLAESYLDRLLKMPAVNAATPVSLENFVDAYATNIAALKQLRIKDLAEFILLQLGLKRLDIETVKAFESSIRNNENFPSSSELIEFVREQQRILNRAQITQQPSNRLGSYNNNSTKPHKINSAKAFINVEKRDSHSIDSCFCCKKGSHLLYQCPKFTGLEPRDRFNLIKSSKTQVCVNCLSTRHGTRACKSLSTCKLCALSHHSLLHFKQTDLRKSQPDPTTSSESQTDNENDHLNASNPVSLCVTNSNTSASTTVLLGTAICVTRDSNGQVQTVRALIDSGSQRDIITRKCCSRLNLTVRSSPSTYVTGIGDVQNLTKGMTCLKFFSRYDDAHSYTIKPYVVETITSELPTVNINRAALSHLDNLPLADKTFYTPGEIDIILGSDMFARILKANKISGSPGQPFAVETTLGYLILGTAPTMIENPSINVTQSFCTFAQNDEFCLSRFFELEDIPDKEFLTPDEQECEDNFKLTTSRDTTGRFIVALPFRKDPSVLGASMPAAERRYRSLERRLISQPAIKIEYDKILREYLQKGYISPVENSDLPQNSDSPQNSDLPHYVIPHHIVVREDKLTTKIRMVLDASMKSDSGYSLNDILYTGKNLQGDLFRIILKFRLFAIAITADIKQMYLQIVVQEECRRYQRILYRFNDGDPLQLFEFNRVTFGMSCSPFLALRTLRQLASHEKSRFPLAANLVENGSFYMDDFVTSCSSVEEASELSTELIQLFAAGGFDLVKFSSNSPKFLSTIPSDRRIKEHVEFNPDENLKILGLHWIPASDNFIFVVHSNERICTKRNILSTIARIWDLMGFVAPVVLLAKLIIKSLWEYNLDWDDTPPDTVVTLWRQFEKELPLLQSINIPRFLGIEHQCELTLIGFSDASERAFGGVIYLHVYCPNTNKTTVSLLCAKSKVAPAKTISLARLELCGALVLARLMRTVSDTYASKFRAHTTLAFCDSTVALAWINSPPARWQTFVANRVSQIQNLLEAECFHYIKGKENPADCLSRGLTPAQLINHPLWFNGPAFVQLPKSDWPLQRFDLTSVSDLPELKTKILMTVRNNDHLKPTEPPLLTALASRVNSWQKLIRIVIYIFRFLKKLPRTFELSHIGIAEIAVIRSIQQEHFSEVIKAVTDGKKVRRAIAKLNPFLHDGILRVGGRLNNAEIEFDSRHPILLPARDHVVDLIIDYYHVKNLHTGPTLLMSLLRQRFWILSSRSLVRKRVHRCNTCFKVNPKPQFPIMGDLPACRVREAKAFLHTGVDYAGPLQIIPYRRRGVRSQKAYVCLFICLVTRAVHIELASDLSTEVFLNAFKRFLSRRGPVSTMYSDNGTNFVGTKSHLKSLYELIESPNYKMELSNNLQENRIEWKMNPPQAPHFGGIWESNIKSVKSYLNKIVGTSLLTYEEMQTVLSQIEAILNSRPLSVLSVTDVSAPLPLTPAHFLTLTPLKSLPAADLSNESVNLLQRKHLVDHLVQTFWNRWRVEYLNNLQSRQKWNTSVNPVTVGTIVIIKCDNIAPLQWPIGIIVNVYPGSDGVTRVADVKTNTGTYRRAVVKLCPLPSQ